MAPQPPKRNRRLNDADTTFLHVGAASGMPIAPLGITVYERPFDADTFQRYQELQLQAFPNGRSHIVEDRLSIALPRWVDLPEDRPEDHIEILPPPGDGTYRAVLDWAQTWGLQPFPAGRSPWRHARFDGVLVNGVPRTVTVNQSHHAFTDGEGGKRLGMKLLQWSADEALPEPEPPEPFEEIGTLARWVEGWSGELRRGGAALRSGGRRAAWAAREPKAAAALAKRVWTSIRYLREDLGSDARSPLLRRRSTKLRFDHLEIDMPSLKAGAKSVGGTVNDGFLAAITLGVRKYHLLHEQPVPEVRASMAVNLRSSDDETVGNKMIAVVLRLPLDSDDAADLVRRCGEISRRHRSETDGMKLMRIGQVIANRMPRRMVEGATRKNMGGMDLQLSNLQGTPLPHWTAGREVLQGVPFPVGTLSGIAIIMTHRVTRTDLGMITDPEAVSDPEVLVECLMDGFRAVGALVD